MAIVINFGHPLSPDAVRQLTEELGEFETRTVRVQLDMNNPLAPQLEQLVDSVGFNPDEWQTTTFVVILPGASVAAGLVLAQIHGRSGYFPRIVHLVAGDDRVFRLGEVIGLQSSRDSARKLR